ncbi:MAG TPA: hypothetical protein VFD90_04830 [Gaiellales bacterium]|nr:hypothetical protein [Gaiellales bacterium]
MPVVDIVLAPARALPDAGGLERLVVGARAIRVEQVRHALRVRERPEPVAEAAGEPRGAG